MTIEEFQKTTQLKNSFDKYWHYFVAISFSAFSLYGMCYVTFVDEGKFKPMGYIIYPGLLFILAFSLSGFYLLPNRYKIVELESFLCPLIKSKIASDIIYEYCGTSMHPDINYFVGYTKSKWWQSSYQLHFFYDDMRFAFSLQGHDSNGGWIDFGGTERERKRIAKSIINSISQESAYNISFQQFGR